MKLAQGQAAELGAHLPSPSLVPIPVGHVATHLKPFALGSFTETGMMLLPLMSVASQGLRRCSWETALPQRFLRGLETAAALGGSGAPGGVDDVGKCPGSCISRLGVSL